MRFDSPSFLGFLIGALFNPPLATQGEERPHYSTAPRDDLRAERELWACVLMSAIEDVRACTKHSRARKIKAEEWFVSTSEDVRSFQWVCGQLGIDADSARRRILGRAGMRVEK